MLLKKPLGPSRNEDLHYYVPLSKAFSQKLRHFASKFVQLKYTTEFKHRIEVSMLLNKPLGPS